MRFVCPATRRVCAAVIPLPTSQRESTNRLSGQYRSPNDRRTKTIRREYLRLLGKFDRGKCNLRKSWFAADCLERDTAL